MANVRLGHFLHWRLVVLIISGSLWRVRTNERRRGVSDPTADFSQYNKVLLDPVAIWTTPDSKLNSVPQNQRQAAANRFHADLYNALSKRCQMVTSPSPGTLRLSIAVTDATTPNAAVNTVAHAGVEPVEGRDDG